ncbi:MAG TPA: aminotransferase class V-fold PLP-dependent enzyme [Gemmatimonadales bacterium]|nr:aminotransferase class V-fold PLP-dependent enzyme [Gemmatimonadales bacterium]
MTPVSAASAAGYDVRTLRNAEFPGAEQQLYLNHASTGPLPERSRRALEAFAEHRGLPFRHSDEWLQSILAEGRRAAARLINADVAEIALATNTSYGLNLAARMLPFAPGDIVLVSDAEFPANVFPWRQLTDKGVTMELVPLTARGWPDETRLKERMQDRKVRALAISHVQFHNGYAADLDDLSAAARASGTWLVVDAIQALGHLPFDVRKTPVDILACGAQKWLLSPWGSGFVYVRRELVPELASPFAGWSAFEGTANYTTLCDYSGALRGDARRFELITLPFQDILGMSRALDLLDELGVARIARHIEAIGQPVLEWADRRGVRVVSPRGAGSSGMVCLAAADVPDSLEALRAGGVATSVREGALRLAPHCYNTVEEMSRVAELLDRSVTSW